jgi:antagonist of KipI
MSVRVMRPGLLSTVQDLGRFGLQHLGIVACGAMDTLSHRLANALVGNPDEAATLECTVLGPELIFGRDSLVALYGAEFSARTASTPFPLNRPVLVPAGTTLTVGPAIRGARAYLAIAGGFQAPLVLGSRSTYVPGQFGGLQGRALKAGDQLPTAPDLVEQSAARFARLGRRGGGIVRGALRSVRWSAPALSLPDRRGATLRALEGRHHAQFDAASRAAFFESPWRVSPDSNRMGYRLLGPKLVRARPVEILSEPTCLGTVQVPNDGTPIVLMADHQTTGGYPKIAEIAGADIPELAQLAPGGEIRFIQCTLEEAEDARRAASALTAAVCRSIAWEY